MVHDDDGREVEPAVPDGDDLPSESDADEGDEGEDDATGGIYATLPVLTPQGTASSLTSTTASLRAC